MLYQFFNVEELMGHSETSCTHHPLFHRRSSLLHPCFPLAGKWCPACGKTVSRLRERRFPPAGNPPASARANMMFDHGFGNASQSTGWAKDADELTCLLYFDLNDLDED